MMNKNRLFPTLALAGATSLAAMLTPVAAMAVTFNVNRSWSQGTNNASLVGTVDVPVGSYTIQNGSPNPFTNVNLTLTINGNAVTLNAVALTNTNTSAPAQFLVNATSSVLTFNPDVSGCSSVCLSRLGFIDSSQGLSGPFYLIGSTSSLGSSQNQEQGFIPSPFTSVISSPNFPVTFGTAQQQPPTSVPEPTATVGLLGLGLLGVGSALKRMGK